MSPGEWEPALFVLCQAEDGWTIPFEVVALFASVEIRSRSKLAEVRILVASGALVELDQVKRVSSFRYMALRALDLSMLLR